MIAITHRPNSSLNQCALTHLARSPIDHELAQSQHQCYRDALADAGCEVRVYDFNGSLADAPFVEDVAVVLDELILFGSMGVPSRIPELQGWLEPLREFRTIIHLPPGATLEGGDVLRMGRELIIGESTRTNRLAIDAISKWVAPYGYVVHRVTVHGCLHLKTACTALDDETLLLNPNWLATSMLPIRNKVIAADPWGANILRLPNRILASAQHEATNEQIEKLGYRLTTLNLSEFEKAEAGPTCLSLLI